MKKRWREKRGKPVDAGKEKELRVRASLIEREGKHYGVVDLGFVRETGLPEEALDRVVEALRGIPSTTIGEDPITHSPMVWLGPWDRPADAEVTSRGLVQMICDTLGIRQGDGPRIRPHARGVMADSNTNIQTNPKQLGDPPADLEQRVARGGELAAGPDDALTLVIAAWQRLLKDDPDAHILRLLTLARGVIAWLAKPAEQTPLAVLEARGRGLAQLIANNIPRSDEFVLLLTNQGEGGFYTHISSIGRDTTISLLTEYLNALRGEQLKRS